MVHFIPPSQRRMALLAAQTDSAPAVIHGAEGTGKGALARWIHLNGPRVGKPFVTAKRKVSLSSQFASAQGGTMEIPAIGEWPLAEQMVLLNYLKTKSIVDADGLRALANVRIIATTDQALEGRALGGLFNIELLEKLNVFRIEMPSLLERKEEFEDIVLAIVGEVTRELHKEHLRTLSNEAWESLKSYEWPGNIRELRNVLRVGVVAALGDQIELSDLPKFGPDKIDFRATREQFEKIYLVELLRSFDWEIDKTCELSKMDKPTLLNKIKQYGISRETSV